MRVSVCAAFFSSIVLILLAAQIALAAPAPQAASAKVARGEYLVKHTSMCDDCHTLHDEHGNLVASKHLLGAKIIYAPIQPMPSTVWADTAPPISGLTFLTDEQAVQFFTTGKMPDGKLARIPMPPYRFSKSDAEALTAYLKSLAKPAN
jgi:hypothetical protein